MISNVENFIQVILKNPDDFLRVRETLTRIGLTPPQDPQEKILYQQCHILHKRGKYYIVHYNELFLLDGEEVSFTETEVARRNTIANILAEWGLVKLVDPKKSENPAVPLTSLKILTFKEKSSWILKVKYHIGRTKKTPKEVPSPTIQQGDIVKDG